MKTLDHKLSFEVLSVFLSQIFVELWCQKVSWPLYRVAHLTVGVHKHVPDTFVNVFGRVTKLRDEGF